MMKIQSGTLFSAAMAMLVLAASGCSNLNYAIQEKFGREKRDILKSSIENAKEQQQEASEQFKDALTSLMELYQVDGGELEKSYNSFSSQYERSKDRADGLKDRIRKADKVANDLFREWENELAEITSPNLRQISADKLSETRVKFGSLMTTFRDSERKMDAVLAQLRDQVLFLKHNLNAQAISGLKAEFQDVENDILTLIKDINDSIREAEAFISTLPE